MQHKKNGSSMGGSRHNRQQIQLKKNETAVRQRWREVWFTVYLWWLHVTCTEIQIQAAWKTHHPRFVVFTPQNGPSGRLGPVMVRAWIWQTIALTGMDARLCVHQ